MKPQQLLLKMEANGVIFASNKLFQIKLKKKKFLYIQNLLI